MHTVQAGPWYKTYVIGDGNEGEKANQYQQSHWQIPFPVMTLLLATSIVAFVLVSLPIDPVQQYVMGAGAVSMEQRETISEYWGLNAPIYREIPELVVSNSARRYGSIPTLPPTGSLHYLREIY